MAIHNFAVYSRCFAYRFFTTLKSSDFYVRVHISRKYLW